MQSAGGYAFGSPWHELYRLDRVLAQLTRPWVDGSDLPPTLREQLHDLGLPIRRTVEREELIAEVWGRKRPLLRHLDSLDDIPPSCA